MKKTYLLILLNILCLSCNVQKSITYEKDLYDVLNISSLSYTKEVEYDELKNRFEGIYLSRIILFAEESDSILNIIKSLNKIKLSNDHYFFYSWKKTPIQNDYDLSLTNYSPVPQNIEKLLKELNRILTSEGSYYAFFQDLKNPFTNKLFIFTPKQNRIFIYYSIF